MVSPGMLLKCFQSSLAFFVFNVLHIATADSGEISSEQVEATLTQYEAELNKLGVRSINLLEPVDKQDPMYYSFPQCGGYKEDPIRRNMRPTFHHLLELGRLDANFDLTRIPAVSKNAQIYIGTEKSGKPVRGGPPQVVFVRGVSHVPGLVSVPGSLRALVQGLDELERAQANSNVSAQSSSRIFLHSRGGSCILRYLLIFIFFIFHLLKTALKEWFFTYSARVGFYLCLPVLVLTIVSGFSTYSTDCGLLFIMPIPLF